MKIYLTVILKAKPGNSAALKSALQNMVVHSIKEKACLQYDLFQTLEDENTFIFQEIWENQAGLDLHDEQPYIKEFREKHLMLTEGNILFYKNNKIA